MTYGETLQFLFDQLPMFQRIGAAAFKKDLTNTIKLCNLLDNPQTRFKSVHVAGTNGKGSVSHIMAAILQQAGYKVGLYVSPHYKDFRERIKINGEYISEQEVVDFVARYKDGFLPIQPSFFEITVGMAFDHFARHQVDIAVIEVGMGGRLDSTNVIIPELSIITNIGLDHTQFLGNTVAEIAGEKAGIIKPGVPVVIGETQPETKPVFDQKAYHQKSEITYADEHCHVTLVNRTLQGMDCEVTYDNDLKASFHTDLFGNYQLKNMATAICAARVLSSWGIETTHIFKALANIRGTTSFMGRCQVFSEQPLCIVDSGHNADGVREIMTVINSLDFSQLHFVIGTVNDKDLAGMLQLLPKTATYYFCKPDIPRGRDAGQMKEEAAHFGLYGDAYSSVQDAFQAARKQAKSDDLVFVGGSIFVVAEVL